MGVPWFDGLDKSSNENGLLSPSPRVDDELFEYSSFFEHHEHRVVQQWRYVLNIVKNEVDIFYYIVIFIRYTLRASPPLAHSRYAAARAFPLRCRSRIPSTMPHAHSIPFHSIPFHSIPFHSISISTSCHIPSM
jgi:hypothetical protein